MRENSVYDTWRRRLLAAVFPVRVLRRRWARYRSYRADIADLISFIRAQEAGVALRLLTKTDPGRVLSLRSFASNRQATPVSSTRVAVVSGSMDDPEVNFLAPGSIVEVLSFDEDPDLFDLGKDWSMPRWASFNSRYDFVLCSQVLEHVIDPGRAVANLRILLRPGGKLHLNVPAVNNRHDRFYFFAGFSVEALFHWLSVGGFTRIDLQAWNSDKGARMYSTCDWAPLAESGPVVFFFQAVMLLDHKWRDGTRLLLRRIRHQTMYVGQRLFSPAGDQNPVVVWGFAEAD